MAYSSYYDNDESEIDDSNFFLSKDGKTNPKSELYATIDALINETYFDDNSTACKFPARKQWLKEKLNIEIFPKVECSQYDIVLKKLQPTSTTLVFPAAHINSPASMFGHTFLRINSHYKSKLLSYAINYAADADPSKENGFMFAMKGLFGGYYGKYSLLPYYEKLKEYRDTEQRDVWEYDLNLTKEETLRMFRHIWELNGTHSTYYFTTQNCSYNMLWFLEAAREDINLRDYFTLQVIPLETVHAVKLEDLIVNKTFRPSKRTILLKYESLIDTQYIDIVKDIFKTKYSIDAFLDDNKIEIQQKRYILESSIELMEYQFKRNDVDKDSYLERFHQLSSARATLGQGLKLDIQTPNNPLSGHRAIRVQNSIGYRDERTLGFIGIRPSYHDINDN